MHHDMITDQAERKAMFSPHLYGLRNILTDFKFVLSWVGPYLLQKVMVLKHLPSLVYLIGRIQHISCWFHQLPIAAGWTEAPWDEKFVQHFYTWVTVLPYQLCHQQPCHHCSFATMSQLCLTLALPPLVNHAWRLPCHHIYIATVSQTWLTIALPPSVKHGWFLSCHQSDTADFCLATNV